MPRRLGQHFLIRDSILERLAIAACGEHVPRVIEIGPGRGALTRHLLPRTDDLHTIEFDPSLVSYLESKYAAEPKLHVHLADVLSIDMTQWGPAVTTGNLPYYITSPIISRFLRLDERFTVAVFLMQSEVADRVIAGPGTRDYGYLTVASQLVCEVELVCRVPAAAFSPPPKVDSAAVRFRRKSNVPHHIDKLLTFVGQCFTQKRKTLRNNLRPLYGPIVDTLPESGLRAEQLPVAEFADLYRRIVASVAGSVS
jgi:16S rRNA (adenine1518-N6/adenine1519-N6)-dimethyltransferase